MMLMGFFSFGPLVLATINLIENHVMWAFLWLAVSVVLGSVMPRPVAWLVTLGVNRNGTKKN